MNVLQLLASKGSIPYNRGVAKKWGINATILLGALCSYQNAFNDKEFCKEQSKIMDDTCLGESQIREALKVLVREKIVTVSKRGLPAKNYYFVNEKELLRNLTDGGKQ